MALRKITIPQQDLSSEQAQQNVEGMEELGFKPWNRWDDRDDRGMKPLGDVNEARKAVYEASSENRGSDKVNNKRCPMGFA